MEDGSFSLPPETQAPEAAPPADRIPHRVEQKQGFGTSRVDSSFLQPSLLGSLHPVLPPSYL
jgi:hypothetical protein